MVGLKTIDQTIESVLRQKSVKCEILIIRNWIQHLPQGTNVKEREYLFPGTQRVIRELFIREVVELLGPVFWVVYACLLVWKKLFPFLSMVFAGYVLAQFGLTVFAAYIDADKNMRKILKCLPKLILTTIEEMFLQILINVARSIGMITFHWRRLVW